MTDTLDALVERLRAICNSYAGNYDIRRDAGQAADAIAALRAALEEAEQSRDFNHMAAKIALDERDALRAEVEALRKDAGRYRWLAVDPDRCAQLCADSYSDWSTDERWDEELAAAIDAAMKGGGG